ncbi:MAG TPA: hypothetical protein VGM09_14225, partial [Bradyrhizobium sp.]
MKKGKFGAAMAIIGVAFGATMHAARADVFYNFTYTLSYNVNNGSDYSGTFDVSGGTIVGITGTSSEYGTITE